MTSSATWSRIFEGPGLASPCSSRRPAARATAFSVCLRGPSHQEYLRGKAAIADQ
jgi:hypothetical protein